MISQRTPAKPQRCILSLCKALEIIRFFKKIYIPLDRLHERCQIERDVYPPLGKYFISKILI